jgi:hypothetical protein
MRFEATQQPSNPDTLTPMNTASNHAIEQWRITRQSARRKAFPARVVDNTAQFPGAAVRRLRQLRCVSLTPATLGNPFGLRRPRHADALELSQFPGA